jgi:FkbM family methyltransferase
MDSVGAAIKLVGYLSPAAQSNLSWWRQRRHDFLLRLTEGLVEFGDIAVDIGASVGVFTGPLLRMVGRDGAVHAFEPNPYALARLNRFRSRNLTVHPIGLSNAPAVVRLQIPVIDGEPRPGLARVGQPGPWMELPFEEVEARLERLDDVLPRDLEISFIKCDVEGHELAVLEGARETLLALHPRMLIEIEQRHQERDVADTFDFLAELGYVGYAVSESTLTRARRLRVHRDQLAFVGPDLQEDMPSGYIHNFRVRRGARRPGVHRTCRQSRGSSLPLGSACCTAKP